MKPDTAMARTCVLGLALLLIGSIGLEGQADDLRRLRRNLSDADVARVEAVIVAAEPDGVPRSLLIDKAVEGMAKGASPDVIVTTLTSYADELRDAVGVVGPDVLPHSLAKTADALRHGVDREFVSELARARPEDFHVRLQVVEDLLHEGLSLDEAQALVRVATGEGLEGQQVLSLSGAVRRLVREGATPAQAVVSLRESIRSGRIPASLQQIFDRDPPLIGGRDRFPY